MDLVQSVSGWPVVVYSNLNLSGFLPKHTRKTACIIDKYCLIFEHEPSVERIVMGYGYCYTPHPHAPTFKLNPVQMFNDDISVYCIL